MTEGTAFNNKTRHGHNGGRSFGLFIIILGVGVLLRRMNIEWIPEWVLTWPTALILLGIFVGIKHRFKKSSGIIMIAIGALALLHKFHVLPEETRYYLWPLFIIALGLYLVFKPGRKNEPELFIYAKGEKKCIVDETVNNDLLDVTAVFCGSRKNILNKNFKGGEITAIFGGTELNLIQADLQQKAVLDVTIIFGGLKIIVPNNWDVRTNLVNIAAGVEDKRQVQGIQNLPEKILVIEGTVLFGGIDIQNY